MTTEIYQCVQTLKEGKLILFPTDTFWSIGCDATKDKAVRSLINLIGKTPHIALTSLVANQAMLERFVQQVPEVAYDILDLATKPTTLILDNPIGLANTLKTTDNTVALRVVSDKFSQYLIKNFGRPITVFETSSTSNTVPQKSDHISNEILEGVDYIVNLQKEKKKASLPSVIRLGNDGVVKIIRE